MQQVKKFLSSDLKYFYKPVVTFYLVIWNTLMKL